MFLCTCIGACTVWSYYSCTRVRQAFRGCRAGHLVGHMRARRRCCAWYVCMYDVRAANSFVGMGHYGMPPAGMPPGMPPSFGYGGGGGGGGSGGPPGATCALARCFSLLLLWAVCVVAAVGRVLSGVSMCPVRGTSIVGVCVCLFRLCRGRRVHLLCFMVTVCVSCRSGLSQRDAARIRAVGVMSRLCGVLSIDLYVVSAEAGRHRWLRGVHCPGVPRVCRQHQGHASARCCEQCFAP